MVIYHHVTDLLPAYALDCLDEEDFIMVSEHLTICEQCRTELQSFQAIADQLVLLAPEATPSSDLKDRIMSHLQPAQHSLQEKEVDVRSTWWQGLIILFKQTAPVWGLACLLLAVGLGMSTWKFWQQLHPQSEGDMGDHAHMEQALEVVKLGCTPEVPNAAGELMISKDGQFALLIVVGLPIPEPGYMYQLWGVRNGQRESGGMFTVTSNGYGSMTISIPKMLSGYSHFDVTIEPAEGSPVPTGETVLVTRT
jgi:hypothetical protein